MNRDRRDSTLAGGEGVGGELTGVRRGSRMGANGGGSSGKAPGGRSFDGDGRNLRLRLRLAPAGSGSIRATPVELGGEESLGGREDGGKADGVQNGGRGVLVL